MTSSAPDWAWARSIFRDHGSALAFHRPGYQAMLTALAAGDVDTVVVCRCRSTLPAATYEVTDSRPVEALFVGEATARLARTGFSEPMPVSSRSTSPPTPRPR